MMTPTRSQAPSSNSQAPTLKAMPSLSSNPSTATDADEMADEDDTAMMADTRNTATNPPVSNHENDQNEGEAHSLVVAENEYEDALILQSDAAAKGKESQEFTAKTTSDNQGMLAAVMEALGGDT